MNLVQLTGRQIRLKQELAAAGAEVPTNVGRIARLTDELAGTERRIAAVRAEMPTLPLPIRPSTAPMPVRVEAARPTHAWIGSFAARLMQLRPLIGVGSAVRYAVLSIHHAAELDPRRAAELLLLADPVTTPIIERPTAAPRDPAVPGLRSGRRAAAEARAVFGQAAR